MSTAPRTTLTLPANILAGLDQAAEAERRSRSNMASLAIEQYLRQRSAVTGESRLRDLEALADQHTEGASVTTSDESINKRLAEEAKMPAPRISPPNRSHLTAAERKQSNEEFLRSHPNGKLLERK